MRRSSRELLRLSYSLHSHLKHHCPLANSAGFQGSCTFSSSSNSQRDSLVLEQFRQRKLKGSSKGTPQVSSSSVESSLDSATTPESVDQKGLENESEAPMVVANFKELGVSEELVEVLNGIGDFVPSEIQCVAIPAILEGKSVLLSSPPEPDRTLAYLLPLIQLLRRDGKLLGSNSKHPRAIVLCASEEKAEQCFNAAGYIMHNVELKSTKNHASPDNEKSNASIGLMIGTPCEILQYIEEGIIVPPELRYLVLDEADWMLSLGPEIHKILKPLQDHVSKTADKRLQTILAISTIAEVVGEESPLVKHLEHDHAGNISAMSLEMERTEVFQFTESLDGLRKKLVEAMDSLLK